MQGTAIVIKLLGIILQYGLLALLLYFVYKLIKFMTKDSREIREDIYAVTEISNEEAVLTVLEAADATMIGQRFAFSDEISIGRGTDNDIILNDSFASHHHAVIALLNNLYVIEDMGSVNKTYVNGQAITGRQYLQSGDIITIGSVSFEFGR
ncbi:MAG: FHA domain-containing protein [Anaerovibrio sp.]|uniref:FHA domain-containing protein n=1 Tax=Anaerovibrio sp. TaxID=1872532 RepID=UPI0025BB5B45|nr:FHA domain-containing protein [Anaerovibrio sp.]MBE6100338.1 FHA domain-containing protein [Anaerovibrio sp.]MBQ3854911.1 FHA domain-containing protein [Anaerovibrio sp.]